MALDRGLDAGIRNARRQGPPAEATWIQLDMISQDDPQLLHAADAGRDRRGGAVGEPGQLAVAPAGIFDQQLQEPPVQFIQDHSFQLETGCSKALSLPCALMGLIRANEKLELTVSGMTCGNCVRHVTEALEGVSGVVAAAVSLEGAAVVTVKSGKVNREALAAAVTEAGYQAA